MPLKTFLATVEVRIVVEVPEDFSEDDLNNSLDTTEDGKFLCGDHKLHDVSVLDVSCDEHENDDENDT